MKGAFKIEGVDTEAKTAVFEIDRALLAPIANLLRVARQTRNNNIHVAIRSLGDHMRSAARVLYGEVGPEVFGFDVLDPIEETEEPSVRTGTGG